MLQGVQPDHIGSAKGARTGAAELLACQVVHHVVSQVKTVCFLHRGQHAGNADAVGNEVGRVMRANHAFTKGAGHKRFKVIQHVGLGRWRIDQLNQRHVARRVEKMYAAKARLDGLRQGFAELGYGQTRGVAGNDGMAGNIGRNLVVKSGLPVHALGNGLNDQVALQELRHVLFVVGLADQSGVFRHTQRGRFKLFQPFDGLADDAIFRAFPGGQVKQHNRHFEVNQMSRNLRTHDACTENGNFFDCEFMHEYFLICEP